jgi:hypothetical protein
MRRLILRATLICLSLIVISTIVAFPQEPQTPAAKPQEQTPAAKPDLGTEIKPGKEKGKQERFFAYPLPAVKAAVIDAMKSVEFEVKKDNGNNLEGKRKRHIGVMVGSGGETLVVQLKEAEEGGVKGTKVVAETKKGFIGRVGQKSWTNAVLNQADRILKEAKQ